MYYLLNVVSEDEIFLIFFQQRAYLLSFLVRGTDNYRMLSENSRGNLAVFSFSGQREAAKLVRSGFEPTTSACNLHHCAV